jgi:exodeoxyribonuclease VII small subunit
MCIRVFSHILITIVFCFFFPLASRFLNFRAMTKSASTPKTFEAAMSELEAIVRQMETGSLPLEQALEQYQRGVILLRHCQDKLDAAEQQIRILEGNTLVPFQPKDSGANDSVSQCDSTQG